MPPLKKTYSPGEVRQCIKITVLLYGDSVVVGTVVVVVAGVVRGVLVVGNVVGTVVEYIVIAEIKSAVVGVGEMDENGFESCDELVDVVEEGIVVGTAITVDVGVGDAGIADVVCTGTDDKPSVASSSGVLCTPSVENRPKMFVSVGYWSDGTADSKTDWTVE